MEDFVFIDALSGDAIGLTYAGGDATMQRGDGTLPACTSVFFPGCSFLNYAMPLVSAVYDTLVDAGQVDGISVLCCGKILSYEPNGESVRAAFEEELCDAVAASGIQRFVCACPNCVKALREAFASDARTAHVEIAVLPHVLADLGYRLEKDTCALLVKGDADAPVLFCTHDSCPDREYGDFARGLRALMPDELWKDPMHCRRRSICCGSLPRAAGKFEQADRCADRNGQEALEIGADAIITACVSCDFQLNIAQRHLPCVHYLEMLYAWRIDWRAAAGWMKLRFLFNGTLGALEKGAGERAFAGVGAPVGAPPATIADTVVGEHEPELSEADRLSASDAALSNRNTCEMD
ncbi:heterodisulfide reductase-related iron-sulfur binding cluster [Adlercreutzia murintestinalis]|uniref:heterodisulfide reductase-related iron-sulfur binding cluster n=1 Tax=Adlercreutzia murintestinalis TaxID=2941325 RepID=UPI00203FB32B|nr:heterodisulfide reductase-related iron-sulfur binding cluster [Adlercreutzia murintestinalis]